VLLITLFTTDPLEFSIFPSMLLLITLLRLGLNVSSTRLILGQGSAGGVIAAFGNAVIGGNYVVGLVIFLILVVINFMVITKGAGRIAEVAARFTLDAMPGRQMSIDADLSAGLIDEDQARERRGEINRYADFYGSMDGAAKFVRGDAIAGLLITGVNLLGGFVIGMVQRGMGAAEALSTYTVLTVGDGLVTQIPALIVSTAAGIIVTYGTSTPSVGPAIAAQLTRHPRAVWMVSGILAAFAVVPGFPKVPFILLSGVAASIAWVAQNQEKKRLALAAVKEFAPPPEPEPAVGSTPQLSEVLHVDPLELEIGYALVPLVDESRRGDLLMRIGLMRKQVAMELGIIVPPVRVRDNIQLPATEYAIKLRGVRVAKGEVMPQYLLALDPGSVVQPLEGGIHTLDPSFGMNAVWIKPERRTEAETDGYSVVEPQTVLATHMMETVKRHAADLLRRQDAQELLDAVKENSPALIDDLIPGKVSLGTVHRVLQRLLKEGIPIRDLATILEAIADGSEGTKDPEMLAEAVRRTLGPVITQLHDDGDGTVRGITVGPRMEAALMNLFAPSTVRDTAKLMQPAQITDALGSLSRLMHTYSQAGQRRPLITPPSLRLSVRRLVEPVLPGVPVISLGELAPTTPIESLATWELAHAA
jgi:flagellar biosynthesis protein FlhA